VNDAHTKTTAFSNRKESLTVLMATDEDKEGTAIIRKKMSKVNDVIGVD